MRRPSRTRSRFRGVPVMLLAALVLFARLVGPSAAMPRADDVALAGLQAICHAGAAEDRGPEPSKPPGHGDCLLCPACHLASTLVLPQPDGPPLPARLVVPLDRPAPRPPATGPPGRAWSTAQSTGPPALSA